MSGATRYIGRIVSVPGGDGFAFIGIGSVTKEDGASHGLVTTQDIFVHEDDCASGLKVGMEVLFDVMPDRKRGKDALRAVGAVECVEAELLPRGEEPIPGFAIALPTRSKPGVLAERLPVHAGMKPVPETTVSQVVANNPLPGIPRIAKIPDDEAAKQQLVQLFLATLFPHLASFGTNFRILDHTDVELDHAVQETVATYRDMGLIQEIGVLTSEVTRFKDIRATLALILEENLVRPDAVIPIHHLPDLYMAAPVWYFWVDQSGQEGAALDWENPDPQPHAAVKHFCGLFPSQRWCDTFQLFNRRVRTLKQYRGELIPPLVARRMRKAVQLFDYVVIATPYHDQSGKEWENPEWLRALDPYVLGFKNGVEYFFVLARFSDSGTFPLLNELVADTIEFLRARKAKLISFNRVAQPYWCHVDKVKTAGRDPFGDYLVRHVSKLVEAFEAGKLFDWLRGETTESDSTVAL